MRDFPTKKEPYGKIFLPYVLDEKICFEFFFVVGT